MSGVIEISDAAWRELRDHLLPPNSQIEEGAFLLARHEQTDGKHTVFRHIETILLKRQDFASQEDDYLELADETRGRLIKRAHDLEASLVEFHSHPGPYPACFSPADLHGFSEFVPHVLWRLKQRPYAAVVVAPSGFDGLIWSPPAHQPMALKALSIGGKIHSSTGLTINSMMRRAYGQI